MKNRRNYYRVLHVQRDAPVEIIKTSYRTLMQRMKMHPDLGGDHGQATLINEAFATLCDADKRAAYDGELRSKDDEIRNRDDQSRNERGQEEVHAKTNHDQHAQNKPEQTNDWANSTGKFCPFCATPYRHENSSEQDCRVCASPLSKIPVDTSESSLQRQVERVPKSFPIKVCTNWKGKVDVCTAVDWSPAGMRFTSSEALPTGKIIKIDSVLCTGIAQVRHCSLAESGVMNRYETGVQFLTLRFNRAHGNFVSVVA